LDIADVGKEVAYCRDLWAEKGRCDHQIFILGGFPKANVDLILEQEAPGSWKSQVVLPDSARVGF
jgi:hypothetical protein